ncbi:hypothetical protein C7974DRAFT_236380 [Boeremia exigua]|uniref:uncharacterized protein n=1 Tax=Boeremia exigua TaxID=749465 RepID=UPI001E8E8A7E|nr:uncharacterized protein C7974DRAFT_236380 [Boeremia exigua]KAH6620591.1 hypothetical protein C7974DRAFT_236380 [Boeremia exigua]
MSARGARSRKVQQKDIEKKDKKVAVKGKAPENPDAFADWRATPSSNGSRNTGLTRSMSNRSHGTSHSSGSATRSRLNTVYSNESSGYGRPPKSSASGGASISDHSAKGKETAKFQTNGKETKAPRGRGGGVPIKTTAAPPPMPPQFRSESPAPRLPSHKKTWLDFRIWEGPKEDMRPYGGFAFDEDMHSGSVLIYFKEEQLDEDHPMTSIRAELEVLQSSGSSWLNNALMMGRVDDDDDDWALTAADEFVAPPSQYGQDRRMLGPTHGSMSPPPLNIDHGSLRAPSRNVHRSPQSIAIDRTRSPSSALLRQNNQRNPTHEIWFTAPTELRTSQAQRLHHVAIRNFLALLHGKPIVGADVFDMLTTLQAQIQVMYDLDGDNQFTSAERSVQMITDYLSQNGVDDARNDIKHALSLLAWAEQDGVKWRQGYLECFTHLAGAMTPQTEELSEFKRLSIVTRRNLGIAAKTLQLRVMEAEERLASFDFADLWKSSPKLTNGPVYQSYQAFRQFLIDHYGRIYGTWPPPSGTWLNRKTVLAMQNDFGSLYDYLVNRDVYWNPREERASRKWEMQHRKSDDFEADLPELGITDMLVVFDAQAGYTHIPHPYPLLPREVSGSSKEKEKKGFFSSLKKDKTKNVTKDAKAHLQLSIVFSDATNIEKMDINFNGSTLIDKFEQFELAADLKNVTPREARLGRWVLLYGILQVLSTLSVDVHSLRHTDGVRYFLCTDLKRCPEWVTNGQTAILEPTQERSWCWQRAWDPTPIRAAPVELDATSPDRHTFHPPRSNSVAQSRPADYPQASSPPPQRPLPPAPLDFDGATLMQNDITRISEKIDSLSMNANASRLLRTEYERRRENEKVMAGEFKSPRINDVGIALRHLRAEEAQRGIDTDYAQRPLPAPRDRDHSREAHMYAHRPLPPPRSPLRSPGLSDAGTDLGSYPFSAADSFAADLREARNLDLRADSRTADMRADLRPLDTHSVAELGFPSPPSYPASPRERSASRPPGYAPGYPAGYGSEALGAGRGRERSASKPPGYEERVGRRERGAGVGVGAGAGGEFQGGW